MQKQEQEVQVGHRGQIRIYSHDKIQILAIDNKLLGMTIQQVVVNVIRPVMGYSSRIHLYKQPLCSFNKIDYHHKATHLRDIIKQVGDVCFTYNNTQYAEQPDYNHQPNYTRPPSQDTIQVVVQIMQNNFFVHQNYRISLATRLSFFTNVCTRYGNNIQVQFYNTRLHLAEFAPDSVVEHTVAKFLDHMNRLTITVDSVHSQDVNPHDSLRTVSKHIQIDTNFYVKLCILENNENGQQKYFVVSKKCSVNSLRYLLQIRYKQQISLYWKGSAEQIKQGSFSKQEMVIGKLKKEQQKLITMQNPIQNCQIVGTVGDSAQNSMQVILMQQSCIMHRIHIDITDMKCYTMNVCHLPCIGTPNLDEDLFFIKDQQLLSYAITINMIKLKYYTLDGNLLMLKVFPWHHQLYQIQFNVVDLFCVRLKNDKKNVRVFFIYDPQNYIDVGPFAHKFYPAKNGNNIYSDDSGIFAISNQWAESVQVYSLKQTKKLAQIRLLNYKQLFQVFFSQQLQSKQPNRNVVLNFNNKLLAIYSIEKSELLLNILCEKGMSNFFCIKDEVACSLGSQIRIFNNKNSQQQKQTIGWKQPKHIVQKCGIIIAKRNKLFIRDVTLQYSQFNRFYIYG